MIMHCTADILGHLLALRDLRVVQVGVQHDGGEGQNVSGISVCEGPTRTQVLVQMSSKRLHDSARGKEKSAMWR